MTHKHSSSVLRFFHLRLWNTKGISQVNEIMIIYTAESNILTWKLSMDRAWKREYMRIRRNSRQEEREKEGIQERHGRVQVPRPVELPVRLLTVDYVFMSVWEEKKRKRNGRHNLVRCKGDSFFLGKDVDKSYTTSLEVCTKRCNMDENRIVLI